MSDEISLRDTESQGSFRQEAWGTPLNVFYCARCHSAHLAPEDVSLSTCPACVRSGVSAQPERLRREPPELVIPFALGEQRAADLLQDWAGGMWFRPAELTAGVLLSRMRHCYLPMWLVDGDVKATWQAELGYDYQAASYRERYQSGQWRSQEVTETRTRWEPRVGRLDRHYDNIAVPALEEHDVWMSRLGGYDFRSRKAYAPRSIAGSAVRVPDHAPDAAWPDVEAAFQRAAEVDCQAAGEADHVRGWAVQAEYDTLNWTQMLVPVYVSYYREGEQAYPVWINGQSGQVHGTKVMSQGKANVASLVIGGVAALLVLFAVMLGVLGAVLVAPVAIAVIVGGFGLLLGLLAPVPAMWAWLSNRRAGMA